MAKKVCLLLLFKSMCCCFLSPRSSRLRARGDVASLRRRFCTAMSGLLQACAACAGLYFTAVLVVVLPNFTRLFALRFGRAHRVAGVVHLSVLLLGMVDLSVRLLPWLLPFVTTPPLDIRNYSIYGLKLNAFAVYDLVLGVSGILLTYTAATDFGIPKARLRNAGRFRV